MKINIIKFRDPSWYIYVNLSSYATCLVYFIQPNSKSDSMASVFIKTYNMKTNFPVKASKFTRHL